MSSCEACGEKAPGGRGFPSAVVEINNPEQLVLMRKVILPASMGTEEDVPASVGKYRNVLLVYEANNHIYLYSSDGIPTLLTQKSTESQWTDLANRIKALDARITALEDA